MKVSRKVGRRKRASSVSVSRRRLRNKKSKSGYRKKHAKTQRGGKRGKCTRTRSRGYKRGRRFHRGGVITTLGTSNGYNNLYYKKISDTSSFLQNFPFTDSGFIATLEKNDDNNSYNLTLRRTDGTLVIVVTFTFENGKIYYDKTEFKKEKGLSNISDESGRRTYIFPYENSLVKALNTEVQKKGSVTHNVQLLDEVSSILSRDLLLQQEQQQRIQQYAPAAPDAGDDGDSANDHTEGIELGKINAHDDDDLILPNA